jgi:hypothetical protein
MEAPKVSLEQLAIEICQEPLGSPMRQRKLTVMIKALSQALWKENSPYYGDALQDTYAFLCRRLCDLYDSEKALVKTWLNNHLKWRLFSLKQEASEEAKKRIYMPASPEEGLDPIANLPAPALPEYSIVDATRDWLLEDKTGELRSVHMLNRPDINVQSISLRRLPPPEETSWAKLATEYRSTIPGLSAFYQRKCVPRLRKFLEDEGIGG